MDDTALRAILAAEQAAALSSAGDSDLGQQRARAMDYYLGEMADDMPSLEGRSAVVSSDVSDTIESLMPTLMEIFTSGDDVCEFAPVGPEDVDGARQETDYVNHVFWNKNPGFLILYSFVKDALLSKVGVVKYWWETGEKHSTETYYDQPDEAYTLLVADPDIEVVEHSERTETYTDEQGQEQTDTLHDVTVRKSAKYGCARVMPVPPEEFGISKRARNIKDSPYCYHKRRRAVSDLIEEGYDRSQLADIPSAGVDEDADEQARHTLVDEDPTTGDTVNRAMREVEVVEHYIRVDYDDDGVAELRKITTAGKQGEILKLNGKPDNEPFDAMPFAAMTPIIMTHRFYGRSIADLVIEIQRIKTSLLRTLLDNAYFANNQRIEVSEAHASEHTLDDLLTNRPGGIVRTRQPGGLLPIPSGQMGFDAYNLIEYIDTVREQRTGTLRNMQGLKPDTLHETFGGAQQMLNMAQQRVKLIARIFAETGVKDLFMGLHGVIQRYQNKPDIVRLRGKWVPVDPRNWKTRDDMDVMVGLGAGTKEQQLAFLAQLIGFQTQAIQYQGGIDGPLVTLPNIYATLKKMVEDAGLRTVDPYFTDPDSPQAKQMLANKQPPPDPKMVEVQGKLQLAQQQAAAQLQAEAAKSQAQMELEAKKGEAEHERKTMEIQSAHELKRQQMVGDFALKEEQMRGEFALKQQQLEAELALKAAATKAQEDRADRIADNDVQLGGEPG